MPVLRPLQFVAEAPGGELSTIVEARGEPRGSVLIDPLPIPKPATPIVAPTLDRSIRERFPDSRILLVFVQPVDLRRVGLEKQQQNMRAEDSQLRFERLKPGTWKVSAVVRIAGTFSLLDVDDVELKAGETKRLDADLAPPVFYGRVTAGGRGIAVLQHRRSRISDAQGEARFERLLPGRWLFSVRDEGRLRGTEKSIKLYESQAAELDLEVDRVGVIEGTVRDYSGSPVAHARLDCIFSVAVGMPGRSSRETDAGGAFTIDLPPQSSMPAFCGVIATTGVVDAFRGVAGQTIDVRLPQATASLRIDDWAMWYSPDAFWLAATDGRLISLSAVAQFLGHSGQALQIPGLAAGHWRIVQVRSIPQWVAVATGQAAGLVPVAEVDLEPGTTQTVHIYAPSASIGGGI